MLVKARYVGGECGHGRSHPNFTLADIARGKLIDTCSLDKLTFIFVVGLPYEFGLVGVEAMTRI